MVEVSGSSTYRQGGGYGPAAVAPDITVSLLSEENIDMATVTTGTSSASGTSPAGKLLTAEEYFRLPTPEKPTELVRGEIVEMNQPGFQHGIICGNVYYALRQFVEEHNLGRVVSNDAGIITGRNPDTVRGADIAYYSFSRLPAGKSPEGYPDVPPDVVVEVRSPSDRWNDVLKKVAEYLEIGVRSVEIVDAGEETLHVYDSDHPVRLLRKEDVLELPSVLPGFSVSVASLLGPSSG